ncbi:MAG: NTP transferase domain-containing protein [Salinivirgaceae bacterium]|mgnify:CR=1 FL=1|jgi:choline kinase
MSAAKSIIISCAGVGSRLGLGQTKALVKINDRTIIAWQLELFKDIEDVRIVIGYQAKEVVKEVLKHRKDVIFVYNHEYYSTKTGASFYLGCRHGNEYAIEWDGDLLVHPDDVKKLLQEPGEFIGYSEITSDEAVYVQTDKQGNVLAFSWESGQYEWTGPACIKRDKVVFTKGNVFEQIEPHLPIKGVKIRAYDIDTYDDYKRVSEFVKSW